MVPSAALRAEPENLVADGEIGQADGSARGVGDLAGAVHEESFAVDDERTARGVNRGDLAREAGLLACGGGRLRCGHRGGRRCHRGGCGGCHGGGGGRCGGIGIVAIIGLCALGTSLGARCGANKDPSWPCHTSRRNPRPRSRPRVWSDCPSRPFTLVVATTWKTRCFLPTVMVCAAVSTAAIFPWKGIFFSAARRLGVEVAKKRQRNGNDGCWRQDVHELTMVNG